MDDNVIVGKSKGFAIRVIKLYKHLCSSENEFVLSRQILRSGTSIGANVHEAIEGQSRKDFISKMQIALKEARETGYWLELLHETDYISQPEYNSLNIDCTEIIKILVSIIKTAKK